MLDMPEITPELISRFEGKVNRASDCHEWQSTRDVHGYGKFHWGGRRYKANRIAAAIAGIHVDGVVVCHICDNPGCVNPSHLFVGTQLDNIKDMLAKGRHGHAKKTHCPHGHAYTPANTAISKSGRRNCRECDRIRSIAKNERFRAYKSEWAKRTRAAAKARKHQAGK